MKRPPETVTIIEAPASRPSVFWVLYLLIVHAVAFWGFCTMAFGFSVWDVMKRWGACS